MNNPLLSKDNLDAAQYLVENGHNDHHEREAMVRALIDIGRTLRSIETILLENLGR